MEISNDESRLDGGIEVCESDVSCDDRAQVPPSECGTIDTREEWAKEAQPARIVPPTSTQFHGVVTRLLLFSCRATNPASVTRTRTPVSGLRGNFSRKEKPGLVANNDLCRQILFLTGFIPFDTIGHRIGGMATFFGLTIACVDRDLGVGCRFGVLRTGLFSSDALETASHCVTPVFFWCLRSVIARLQEGTAPGATDTGRL
ncbi:MAG: hypothetical protein IH987_03455 [Planctomycetes bacterium]|nr:hypothetical protein [Planctomycetota bacterium]